MTKAESVRAENAATMEIIRLYETLQSIRKVAIATGRGIEAVAGVIERAMLWRDPREPLYWFENNRRFCEAMRAAVDAGLEKPPALCVFKDNSPHQPSARFYPKPAAARSTVGSSMAQCADLGDHRYGD